jgi:hypothetical protein
MRETRNMYGSTIPNMAAVLGLIIPEVINGNYLEIAFRQVLLQSSWYIMIILPTWKYLLIQSALVIDKYLLRTYLKSCPATRYEGAWGESRYSSYSFLTSALHGGEWSVSRPDRALPPGKVPRYPLYRRLGGPQSRSGRRDHKKNPLPLSGIEPRSYSP